MSSIYEQFNASMFEYNIVDKTYHPEAQIRPFSTQLSIFDGIKIVKRVCETFPGETLIQYVQQ
jgi:hypothetical protein